jgi:biopolymer transport protein ExbD
VLLIIFMATTAFVKDAALNMKLPCRADAGNDIHSNRDLNIA